MTDAITLRLDATEADVDPNIKPGLGDTAAKLIDSLNKVY